MKRTIVQYFVKEVLLLSQNIGVVDIFQNDADNFFEDTANIGAISNLNFPFQPFPVGIHKGWKLHSFINDTQVWGQEISPDSSDTSLDVYGAFCKVRIPPQVCIEV